MIRSFYSCDQKRTGARRFLIPPQGTYTSHLGPGPRSGSCNGSAFPPQQRARWCAATGTCESAWPFFLKWAVLVPPPLECFHRPSSGAGSTAPYLRAAVSKRTCRGPALRSLSKTPVRDPATVPARRAAARQSKRRKGETRCTGRRAWSATRSAGRGVWRWRADPTPRRAWTHSCGDGASNRRRLRVRRGWGAKLRPGGAKSSVRGLGCVRGLGQRAANRWIRRQSPKGRVCARPRGTSPPRAVARSPRSDCRVATRVRVVGRASDQRREAPFSGP